MMNYLHLNKIIINRRKKRLQNQSKIELSPNILLLLRINLTGHSTENSGSQIFRSNFKNLTTKNITTLYVIFIFGIHFQIYFYLPKVHSVIFLVSMFHQAKLCIQYTSKVIFYIMQKEYLIIERTMTHLRIYSWIFILLGTPDK